VGHADQAELLTRLCLRREIDRMKNAARVGDNHQCPASDGGSPHVGGKVLGPGATYVLIGGQHAARIEDDAACEGPFDMIKRGAPSVLIEGKNAARRGDGTVHVGVIMEGHPQVLIGGLMAPGSDADAIQMAMDQIRASDFAKWDKGKEVLAKLEQLQKDGKIGFSDLTELDTKTEDAQATWKKAEGQLLVDRSINRSPDSIASELVHEGSHAVDTDKYGPDAGTTIDQETQTNRNQLDFYNEQRQAGYYDGEQERRRLVPSLRDDVGERYRKLGYPEH
jgi:uncharacterized Zn-binding protein involved in type VI secretion